MPKGKMQNDNVKFKIPLIKPEIDAKKLKIAIDKIAKTGILTKGEYLTFFENKLKKILNVKFAFATSSCTTALHLALIASNIKEGDEVLVSDFSFPATANAVCYTRAKPVFVDIDETFNMIVRDLEKKITSKSKVILVVHAFGYPANMTEIIKLARKHKLLVIEDAACAIGSKHKNKACGTWGDIGCFSFHPRKVLTTGEGGAIVTNNPKISKKIEILRNHGSVSTAHGLEFVEIGYNYRMSEFQAALGADQLSKLEKIVYKRQEIAKYYLKKLSEIPEIQTIKEPKDGNFNFQSFVTLLSRKINRDNLQKYLLKKEIETVLGTYAQHAQPSFRKFGYKPGDLPNSYFAYKQSLTLPLYGQMTKNEIDCVVGAIKEFLKNEK